MRAQLHLPPLQLAWTQGGRIAQLDRPKTPLGTAKLTRVPAIPRCSKRFCFITESSFSADSLAVSVQPPCAIACISICAHVKIPNMAAKPLFGHTEIVHTPLGVGSAAPAAASAVPYMGKETRISRKGQ